MKKIVLYVLSFVLILTSAIIPLSVSADTTTIPNDAKSITAYYTDYVANSNAAPTSGNYTISSTSDLVLFAQLVNGEYDPDGEGEKTALAAQTFAGITVYLENDIKNVGDFDGIGVGNQCSNYSDGATATYSFAGTFDGQNHIIDGANVKQKLAQKTEAGLFGLLNGATVRNLTIGENCTFVGGAANVGALAGRVIGTTTISNVTNKATVTGAYAGGLFGYVGGGNKVTTIENCTNMGTVKGANLAGGLTSWDGYLNVYNNCRNVGAVTCTATAMVHTGNDALGKGAGGLIGRASPGGTGPVLTSCINNGVVTAKDHVGGLIGVARIAVINNCYNYGQVVATDTQASYYGGIQGILSYQAGNTSHPQALTNTGSEDRYGLVEAETKAAMLKTLCQVANGTTTASEKTSIRLITSVDGLGYQAVGFKLQFKNAAGQTSAEEMYWTSTVYTLIKGGDTVVTDYKASDEFAVSSKYFATVTIENLPKSEFGGTLTVTAMVKDKNGDIQYGETYSSVVQELFQTPALESSLDVSGASVGNVTNNVLCTVDVEVKTERKNSLTVL